MYLQCCVDPGSLTIYGWVGYPAKPGWQVGWGFVRLTVGITTGEVVSMRDILSQLNKMDQNKIWILDFISFITLTFLVKIC